MTILEYLEKKGLTATAKTSREYCAPCLFCGGEDRFLFWPDRERFFCRGCGKSGDIIDLLRSEGFDYFEARGLAGKNAGLLKLTPGDSYKVKDFAEPQQEWKRQAKSFITASCDRLLSGDEPLKWLTEKRLITKDSARRFMLGWNNQNRYSDRRKWGLSAEKNAAGHDKKLWLPRGLVIPRYSSNGNLTGLKIRRPDSDLESSLSVRYVFISGGLRSPAFYGQLKSSFIIVESELDAVLLWQEAGDSVTPIATGGAMGKPDKPIIEILSQAQKLLVSLDRDQAGKRMARNWLTTFSPALEWPIPKTFGKDHTEAMINGLDLSQWLKTGLTF